MVKTEPGLAPALIASDPAVFFTTPHYDGYDSVLVRLVLVPLDDLDDLLADSWRAVAPPKLRAQVMGNKGQGAG